MLAMIGTHGIAIRAAVLASALDCLFERRVRVVFFVAAVFITASTVEAQLTPSTRPFYIRAVDDQTNRGVPLVELSTTDHVRYYTDSAGVAVIDDPVFNNRDVYFFVSNPGYEYPKDSLGNCGETLRVSAGSSVTLKLKRLNVAERLYRLTGEGIYRDSVLAGLAAPIARPLINAEVTGEDTAGSQAVVYHNRIYWFFGDTSRLGQALGQFGTAGATSKLPADGGLDPSLGVDLDYFVGEDGFSRPIMPHFERGPAWFDGVTVLKDSEGRERMVGHCANVKGLSGIYGRYFVEFDDAAQRFKLAGKIPLDALRPVGQGRLATTDGIEYVYFPHPFPSVRVRAKINDFLDYTKYEAFTCLKPGEKYASDTPTGWAKASVDRDASGKVVWAWKRDTADVNDDRLAALIKAKKLRADETWNWPVDVETKKDVPLHAGDVVFNDFRHKWIMIAQNFGDVYYLESEQINGPWKWARKVATHGSFEFYNPTILPFFEQAGGRVIYFDGTYSFMFTSTEDRATPRYDYNQLVYRLDLEDSRLKMPGG